MRLPSGTDDRDHLEGHVELGGDRCGGRLEPSSNRGSEWLTWTALRSEEARGHEEGQWLPSRHHPRERTNGRPGCRSRSDARRSTSPVRRRVATIGLGASISSRVGRLPTPRKARLTVSQPASLSTVLMNCSPIRYWLSFISRPVIRKKAAVRLSSFRFLRTRLIRS